MNAKHGKGKAVTGPGGIRCACCTHGKPSYTKKLTSRHNRREAKKNLRNENS